MRFVLKIAVVLVLALCAAFYIWYRQTHRQDLAKVVIPLKAAVVQAEARKPRPVYPHSVVPGGLVTGEEMKKAIAADRVVAAHYTGLDPDRMKACKLTKDTPAFVSYRVKDKTFWTKRRVQLHKGEIVLSDGTNWVRGRCGNRLAFVAQRPFLPPAEEPVETAFDTPEPEVPVEVANLRLVPDMSGPLPEYRTKAAFAERPVEVPKAKKKLLARLPMGAPGPTRPFPQREPGPLPPAGQTDAPEPSAIILMSAGLLCLAGFKYARRTR